MSKLDAYSEKVSDACALIREVSGGSEYFMVFDRHPESVLEFFVAAMAEVEKRARAAEEAKAEARIAELTAQFDAANSLIKDMRYQITTDTATINNLNERLLNAAQAKKEQE